MPRVEWCDANAVFSPDGTTLAWHVESHPPVRTVVVWNVRSRTEILRMRGDRVVSFAQDGRQVLASASTYSSRDSRYIVSFKVGDLETMTIRDATAPPWPEVPPSEPSPGPTSRWRVASSAGVGADIAFDGTVTLWDTVSGQPLGDIKVPGAFDCSQLRFSPDGGLLAVATEGGSLSIITAAPELWRALACKRAARDLTDVEWQAYAGAVQKWSGCP